MEGVSTIGGRARLRDRRLGFTLIELLVTIGIIAVLAAFASTAIRSAWKRADFAKETNAAKVLITAYITASNDRDGTLLRGYDRTVTDLELADGSSIHGPAAQRYPYRLSDYFSNKLQGVVLVGQNVKQIDVSDSYSVSCYPAFGMNYLYIGGDVHVDSSSPEGKITNEAECATRMSQVPKGSSMLVFATAFGAGGGSKSIEGYSILTPPKLTSDMWSTAKFTESSPPASYGNVHARHDERAICAFLDGSVKNLTIDDLRDMRLWSKNAQATDNPNYVIASSGGGGGRR